MHFSGQGRTFDVGEGLGGEVDPVGSNGGVVGVLPSDQHIGLLKPRCRDARDGIKVDAGVFDTIVHRFDGGGDQLGEVGVSTGVSDHHGKVHRHPGFERAAVGVALNDHREFRRAVKHQAWRGALADAVERCTQRIDFVGRHVAGGGRQELEQDGTSVIFWPVRGHEVFDAVGRFTVGEVVHSKGRGRCQPVEVNVSSEVMDGHHGVNGHSVLNRHDRPRAGVVLVQGFVQGDLKR